MSVDNRQTGNKPHPSSQRRTVLLLTLLAVLFVVIPFMFWRDTWFGRQLSPQEIQQYLMDEAHPRRQQHALSQIADYIIEGDSEVTKWYPQVIDLCRHHNTEVRLTAAWVMGQDNQSPEFHRALVRLLEDPQVMVRRNAALSLVRFADSSGHAELVSILQAYKVQAPIRGVVSTQLQDDQQIGTGTLLARIILDRGGEDNATEIRAPFPGHVERVVTHDGAWVEAGDELVWVRSGPTQMLAALQGLYLIGETEDLPLVEQFSSNSTEVSSEVRQQAILTAQAIRTRSQRTPNR